MNKEKGIWRTIGGRHIFIEDRHSLSDAIHDSGKFDKEFKIKWQKGEYNHVVSEINTYYRQDITNKFIGNYYYVFDNNGFNNYHFILRLSIEKDSNIIKEIEEEM